MLNKSAQVKYYPLLEPPNPEAKQVYFNLLDDAPDQLALARSRFYLNRQLEAAARLNAEIPRNLNEISSWIEAHTRDVGFQYSRYLEDRKAGGKRRYFTNKSHALYFLKSVAPTKLVDGAWLYDLLRHWRDARFSALVRIYLEELGEGVPNKNHVAIFKKLIALHGCDQWSKLGDSYFVQGAIQLSLAHHASHFLPEAIGFNLGYEQVPLHLLISAYELNELAIDPYYFTLHITVDNAASGHAQKALEGLFDTLPRLTDRKAFLDRVISGYKLNLLGTSTNSIIDEFDLREELLAIFAAKREVGAQMHSDYCRVAGKSVKQWLSDPAQLPAFLDSLEQSGWIKRHQSPEGSRFWKLLQGEHADMFGVFNLYERQVIHDWIAGDSAYGASRQFTFNAQQRQLGSLERGEDIRHHKGEPRGIIRDHNFKARGKAEQLDDFNRELRALEEQLARSFSKESAMARLIPLMSPAHHHTGPGLMATRIFSALLNAA